MTACAFWRGRMCSFPTAWLRISTSSVVIEFKKIIVQIPFSGTWFLSVLSVFLRKFEKELCFFGQVRKISTLGMLEGLGVVPMSLQTKLFQQTKPAPKFYYLIETQSFRYLSASYRSFFLTLFCHLSVVFYYQKVEFLHQTQETKNRFLKQSGF